jgi:hypothetical protein
VSNIEALPIVPEPAAAAPAETDPTELEDSREVVMMLAVLVGLLIIAAIVFLLVPTEWIGARVEVIIHQ